MIVTMLEADVADGDSIQLQRMFNDGSKSLPSAIRESSLLREQGGSLWRIVTVWRSAGALAEYRQSVETPGGVLMFRSVGAEPTLAVFEVAAHAEHA